MHENDKRVVVHAGRLRHEMVRRGWSGLDLARSPARVSAALAGQPIAAATLGLIAKALSEAPPGAALTP